MKKKTQGAAAPQTTLAVRVGDAVQDCDPRSAYRRGVVTAIANGFATVDWNVGRKSTLALRRIHTKGIRSGARLLASNASEPQAPTPAPAPSAGREGE